MRHQTFIYSSFDTYMFELSSTPDVSGFLPSTLKYSFAIRFPTTIYFLNYSHEFCYTASAFDRMRVSTARFRFKLVIRMPHTKLLAVRGR